MELLITKLLAFAAELGYGGVFFLMAVESSFVPLPSELVVPPVAYLASRGEMNVFLIVLLAGLGSVLGASFNYVLARILGRPLVYAIVEKKWAKFIFLKKSHIEKAEKYFLERGNLATFLGRLVPGIRHLISIPAGFVKMNYFSFVLYTFAGAIVWSAILAALGYFFGQNQDFIFMYSKTIGLGFLAVFVVFIISFFFVKIRRKAKN
ncbi:DedA family protein [Candidatus Peregrinibacteria bacterium CG_4_10_14_0_2_um_filter_38_24]|nr:MAG: DedA family protein [Candidatus Peregrinibacteria bacterium CG_4_10_14_0_2_um_filter_38_24]PJC39280.1 MAG: DedA family protein [Candidatus Peregrinibacteria bacterium CG_4_9_14_0_2_um_filter_38_9]